MLLFDLSQLVARNTLTAHGLNLCRSVKFYLYDILQDLMQLSRRLNLIKSSRALSRVRRLRNHFFPHHKNMILKISDVLRTISVPIIRL